MAIGDGYKPQRDSKTDDNSSPSLAVSSADHDRSILGPRSRHQLGIFFAGASFVMISALLTRRSIYRRYAVTKPPFFHANMTPLLEISGALEALDALGIATINVFSYGIMWGGGLFWAFDINNMTELKQRARMKMPEEMEQAIAVEKDPGNDIGIWPAAALAMHEEGHSGQATETDHALGSQARLQPRESVTEAVRDLVGQRKTSIDRRRREG